MNSQEQMSGVFATIIATMIAKVDMIERGAESGIYECPVCKGIMSARLMGPKKHIWAKCQSEGCDWGMIE